jgi:hypothetical protein
LQLEIANGRPRQHAGQALAMDRRTLLEHLAQAERHVVLAERIVREQREQVEELKRGNRNAEASIRLLRQYEEALASQIADRDRLARRIAEESD